MNFSIFYLLLLSYLLPVQPEEQAWIRTNLMGYQPAGIKVGVWCSKGVEVPKVFQVIDIGSGKVILELPTGKPYGAYGPFTQTCRLDFTSLKSEGKYILRAGGVQSQVFTIHENVYKGSADFALRYMRQQRSGFNPYLNDSCHTHDGYTLYGPMPDSTHINVSGGWHDASDYLQYSTTSANATYHMLMAARDFPGVFADENQANGLAGKNGTADILDEAGWGLHWLMKMHPREDWMFNQVADDRDHISMRIPGQDNQYGRGFERPVYFLSGAPQQRGKFLNHSTGASSTAGKFSSAFSLGSSLLARRNPEWSRKLKEKALSAYAYGLKNPGVSQTASVRSPYIYAEENWSDDMELAAANLARISYENKKELEAALRYAEMETVTPWLGKDTASHYQWYPFINVGHFELAKQVRGKQKQQLISYYKSGIERVAMKARGNAFLRGIPFIWCSNNLTVAFALQCYWYEKLSGDSGFAELEQANLDWILGCNPWGTSMVYGLPAGSDYPADPHSAFTHLRNYPIDGGLVDGPVYTGIYKSLIGLHLSNEDEYAAFQSDLAVYHDDYGDYSTNEPTMDGTASLIYLLAAQEAKVKPTSIQRNFTSQQGGIIRADTTLKQIALVFTGDLFADGGEAIRTILAAKKVKASFFLTGNFYRNPAFQSLLKKLKQDGHYLGAHSDRHLLYCDWKKRDSLLVSREVFLNDLDANYNEMEKLGIARGEARYFLPPYEWYNEAVSSWTKEAGHVLINYSSGTLSYADYTTPDMPSYRNSETIFNSIRALENKDGLNGFILLMHVGTDPKRTDKFYHKLGELVDFLTSHDYHLVKINELVATE